MIFRVSLSEFEHQSKILHFIMLFSSFRMLLIPIGPRRQIIWQGMKADPRGTLDLANVLIYLSADFIQLGCCILIFHLCLDWKMQLLLKTVFLVVIVIFRDLILQLLPYGQRSFEGPTPRHVFDCISTSTQHNGRKSIR